MGESVGYSKPHSLAKNYVSQPPQQLVYIGYKIVEKNNTDILFFRTYRKKRRYAVESRLSIRVQYNIT